MKNFISRIKVESENLLQKTEDELIDKIEKIKKRAKKEPLDNLMQEWFALVQEISYRIRN
jgi:preprotein translocase subunit SecA